MGTILLLEDDESVNRGISFTLQKEGYQVTACRSIREAEEAFRKEKADLLICDVNLPDGSGLDFVSRIRAAGNTYIICLTAMDGETDYVMGYGAGADDYVAKPFSLSVLTLKIQAFFERKRIINSSDKEDVICSGALCMHPTAMKVWSEGKEIGLTKNEWKMLWLFMNHPNQILSKNQILEQLFDAEGDFVDENTIAVNIRRLREKIETDASKPEYIKNIRGMGYIWAKECDKK